MSEKKMALILEGETVALSQGEYSDYDVKAVGVATRDFDPEALCQEFVDLFQGGDEDEYIDAPWKFIKWVIVDKGLIREIPYREWNVGSYGRLDTKGNVFVGDPQPPISERDY